MAPVAAHLSLGVALTEMGFPVTDPVLLPVSELEVGENVVIGRVLWADHFGNLITNIHEKDLSPPISEETWQILVGTERITGIQENYAQGEPSRLIALFGSSGYLEIACNLGSAAEKLGYEAGRVLPVKVTHS